MKASSLNNNDALCTTANNLYHNSNKITLNCGKTQCTRLGLVP